MITPKVISLPPASKSDMLQQTAWRAQSQGMSLEEFRRAQYEKNKARRKAAVKLLKKCPSWHVFRVLKRTLIGYNIIWCEECKEHRAVEES